MYVLSVVSVISCLLFVYHFIATPPTSQQLSPVSAVITLDEEVEESATPTQLDGSGPDVTAERPEEDEAAQEEDTVAPLLSEQTAGGDVRKRSREDERAQSADHSTKTALLTTSNRFVCLYSKLKQHFQKNCKRLLCGIASEQMLS